MLLLKKVQLINFLSHRDTEIKLNENTKLLLDGVSGAGKSTVIDAIIWAFYGKSRSDNRSLVHNGAKRASVTITVAKDGVVYRVQRSSDTSGKNDVAVWTEDDKGVPTPISVSGKTLLDAFIEEKIVGCSYILFINSIAYPQDNQENFAKQTAAKRKEILLEIIKATQLDELYEKSRKKLDTIEAEVGVHKKRLTDLELLMGDSSGIEERISTLVEQKSHLDVYHETISKAISEKQEVFNQQTIVNTNLEHAKQAFSILKTDLDGYIYEVEKNKSLKLTQEKEQSKMESFDTALLNKKVTELSEKDEKYRQYLVLRKEIESALNVKKASLAGKQTIHASVENTIQRLNKEIISLLSSNKKCPSDDQHKCSVCCMEKDSLFKSQVEKNEAELEINTKGLKAYAEEILKIEKEVSELNVKLSSLEVREELSTLEATELLDSKMKLAKVSGAIPVVWKDYDSIIGMIVEKAEKTRGLMIESQAQIDKLTEEKALFADVKSELVHLQNEFQMTSTKLNYIFSELGGLEEKKKTVERYKQEYISLQSTVSDLQSQYDAVVLAKKAFGSNGIKAMLIDLIVPQLEEKMNLILSKLSDFTLRLETQRSSASSEKVVEGLFINIINGQGQVMDLSNYSGGEKIKIYTAISEGLSEYQNIGFRLWDENIINFDSETIDSFIEVFGNVNDRFNQVLCISHIQQVKDLFVERLMIKKQNGASAI